jgi:small-conductance mechanosensitive channel
MRKSRFSKEKRLLSTGANYENTGFGQLPERYVSNRKLISEGTGWKILLLGLGILVVGIVFGVVLPVVGILPVIHFKAAEQDPKQGILVICQLIFMIVVVAIIFLLLLSLFKKAMLRRITGRKAKVKSGFYRIKYTCKKRYMGCYDGDCR